MGGLGGGCIVGGVTEGLCGVGVGGLARGGKFVHGGFLLCRSDVLGCGV